MPTQETPYTNAEGVTFEWTKFLDASVEIRPLKEDEDQGPCAMCLQEYVQTGLLFWKAGQATNLLHVTNEDTGSGFSFRLCEHCRSHFEEGL